MKSHISDVRSLATFDIVREVDWEATEWSVVDEVVVSCSNSLNCSLSIVDNISEGCKAMILTLCRLNYKM